MTAETSLARYLGLAGVLLCGALALAPPFARAGGAPTIGTVLAVSGEVRAMSHGEATGRRLEPGDDLYEGDHIETARGARLHLRLEEDSIIQMGGSSALDLEWVLYAPALDSRNVILSLPQGIVRLIIETIVPRSSFEIKTQTAVAAVQGGGGVVVAKPERTAVVAVGGEIVVGNVRPDILGSVTLQPGAGTAVLAGEAPKRPRAWPPDRLEGLLARTAMR